MEKFIKICSLFLILTFIITAFFPCISNASSTLSEGFDDMPESQLGLNNVLNIILIAVGVVLILLGIAIFIRLNKM